MDALQSKTFTTTRSLTYHYLLSPPSPSSSPSSPLLLFLHGFPDGAPLWQFILPRLLTHLSPHVPRVLVPNLLGYPPTSCPTDPSLYTSSAISSDLLEILSHESLLPTPDGKTGQIIPVGHDWGSFLSQRFYLLHPDLCAGLVNFSQAFQAPNKYPFDLNAVNAMTEKALGYPLFAYWELFTSHGAEKTLVEKAERAWEVMHGDKEGWMKRMFCERGEMEKYLLNGEEGGPKLKEYAEEGKGLREEWIRWVKEDGGMGGMLCWYRATKEGYQNEIEEGLAEGVEEGRKKGRKAVEKPYLFVGSEGDVVCRSDGLGPAIQMGMLEDYTVKVVEGGHWIPYERAEEAAGILAGWLVEKGFVG